MNILLSILLLFIFFVSIHALYGITCNYVNVINSQPGNCNDLLMEGDSCLPECDDGYLLIENASCTLVDGSPEFSHASCLPACVYENANHSTQADCPDILFLDDSCNPKCDKYYEMISNASCPFPGSFQKANCSLIIASPVVGIRNTVKDTVPKLVTEKETLQSAPIDMLPIVGGISIGLLILSVAVSIKWLAL